MPSATKVDIDRAVADVGRQFAETLRSQLGEQTAHFDQQLTQVNVKLDAIMSGEILVTKDQLLKLVRLLKAQGIKLDEHDLFA